MFGFLLTLARLVLQQVLVELAKQLLKVENEARTPIQKMIQQVTGGCWKGQGADAFVQEASTLMVPEVQRVEGCISTMSKNLRDAQDRIEKGDEDVNRLVQSRLVSAFTF